MVYHNYKLLRNKYFLGTLEWLGYDVNTCKIKSKGGMTYISSRGEL